MTIDFQEHLREDRRLAILRFLAEDNDYSLNDSVLQTGLVHIGHAVSRDTIISDFAFLQDVGAITYEAVLPSVYVAKLTSRGLDIAKGRALVPGIKRPNPR